MLLISVSKIDFFNHLILLIYFFIYIYFIVTERYITLLSICFFLTDLP